MQARPGSRRAAAAAKTAAICRVEPAQSTFFRFKNCSTSKPTGTACYRQELHGQSRPPAPFTPAFPFPITRFVSHCHTPPCQLPPYLVEVPELPDGQADADEGRQDVEPRHAVVGGLCGMQRAG